MLVWADNDDVHTFGGGGGLSGGQGYEVTQVERVVKQSVDPLEDLHVHAVVVHGWQLLGSRTDSLKQRTAIGVVVWCSWWRMVGKRAWVY